jgi:hypothetical protein
MRTTLFGIAAVAAAALGWATSAQGATTGLGGIAGRVLDASGAALPGVTVTASCARHNSLASTVTNGRGEYLLEGLPPGECSVAFELTGFEPSAVPAFRLTPDQTQVLDSEMALAPISETVEVVAQRPPEPDLTPLAPPPVVVPSLRPIPQYDLSAVCGPSLATKHVPATAHVLGSRHAYDRRLLTKGEIVTVDGGSAAGLRIGENYVVRRRFRAVLPRVDAHETLEGEHSAGLIQVVDLREDTADAVIVHACTAFAPGDYLAPFVPTVLRSAQPRGRPDFTQAGQILFADEGQTIGAPRRLMVIDLGENRGTQPGQRMTVFRPQSDQRPLVEVGEAVVVAVRADSATVRIEYANDAIYFGDRVAPQR